MREPVLTCLTVHQAIPLRPGFNQLGRNPTNHFRIGDSTVSSFHCEIVVSPEQILVRDLNSTNGTFVDGRQIQECELTGGQILKIGSVEYRLDDLGVRVNIPQPKEVDTQIRSFLLPEGALPCVTHPEEVALWRCTVCTQTFCGECVREIRRKGGKPLRFCKSCRGQCEALPPIKSKKPKVSFLGRITQTIRIFRGPPNGPKR